MFRISLVVVLVAALAALALVPSASAATTKVTGTQTYNDNGTAQTGDDYYNMRGSLVGDWYTTSFQCHSTPAGDRWPCTGTELFVGCLDASGDGTCSQEQTGWLTFAFEFTASASGNGRCQHVITGGGDAFEGASGVITFKDRPTAAGLETTYTGHVSL
jgi:hypothetical protein